MKFLNATVLSLALTLPFSAGAATIGGVTATTSMGTFSTYDISDLTNGDGLSTSGSTDATHGSAFNTMWMSNNFQTTGFLVFDLGDTYSLSTIDIWNYNWSLTDRGVKDFSIDVSLDGINYSSVLTGGVLTQGTGASINSEQFALTGANAQFVRLNIISNHGGPFYTGLSEVIFSGEKINPIPLPAGLPLLVTGLGIFGLLASRRRSSSV